jgi:diadenosine tetraphosphate (Ap4A) HIT family hydrolase
VSTDKFDWRRFVGTPRFIAELPNTVAFLDKRQRFRGRTLVWLKERYDGLSDMPKPLRDASMDELLQVAAAIQRALEPLRINYACYGNIVPQVHWHVVPRYDDDPDWQGPPNLTGDAPAMEEGEYAALAAQIRAALQTL